MATSTPSDNTTAQMAADISAIKSLLTPAVMEANNTVLLDGSNNSFSGFNRDWYYNLAITLVGSVSGDVDVQVSTVMKQIGGVVSHYYLNTTIAGYRVEGIQINSITVITANLSSAVVYISYVGYDKPTYTSGLQQQL